MTKTFEQAYRPSTFREDLINGERTGTKDRFKKLNGLSLFNVETGTMEVVEP